MKASDRRALILDPYSRKASIHRILGLFVDDGEFSSISPIHFEEPEKGGSAVGFGYKALDYGEGGRLLSAFCTTRGAVPPDLFMS